MKLNVVNQAMKKTIIILTVFVIISSIPIIIGLFNLLPPPRKPVSDHSAQYSGGELYWNNAVYKNSYSYRNAYSIDIPLIFKNESGEILARTTDGRWDVNKLKGDETYTFVVLYDFYEQILCIREDYVIPTNGKITAVYWGDTKIENPVFCETIQRLYQDDSGNTFEYETNGIDTLTETQHMRTLYFCYENSPVGTEFAGYLGKVYNKWVITTYIEDSYDPIQGIFTQPYKVICKELSTQYLEELEKYFR